jgi:hypothetical protein
MGVPPSLHPIANSLEEDSDLWIRLLDGTMPLSAELLVDIQRRIIAACGKRHISDEAKADLHNSMHTAFTFAEFEYCHRSMASGKSPGPSGLTSTQVKHWGAETARYVFDLSSLMWEHHHVPEWWQDRLMTLLPKTQGTHDLAKIRPISLFEVIRKLWAGMVAKRVQRVWHEHNLLHHNQHGFRPQHGTHTAILHVLNRLEDASLDKPLFITFWDIRRAFHSIPKWIQRLAWARLGIEEKDLEWFLGLDTVGQITIRTPRDPQMVTKSSQAAGCY